MSPQDSMTSVRRTRRSLAKALGIAVGAAVALPVLTKQAAAQSGPGDTRCFFRGTRILTVEGYRKIERLKVGDLLPTRFGGTSPIRKIDSFTARKGDGHRPVRITRSALDDNVPSVDLVLTAPHAIYMEGVLVSIGNLVNGSTIAFEAIEGEFFHIELENHDVIQAEGAACESLLTDAMTRCAPRLAIDGGRSEIRSRLRSAMAIVIDKRTPLDIVRDKVEERSLSF